MLEHRVKKILRDIIDVAYADVPEEKREKYKWFKLHILPKELKKRNGSYNAKTHIIEVNNPSRGVSQLAKTCLHEVAHHIDWCKRRQLGHGKTFYAEYAKLIYATLDMKIMKKEDMTDEDSGDWKKVEKILEDYVPHHIDYVIENDTIVKVMNGYNVKDVLKEHGYRWNNLEQVWERYLEENEKDKEKEFLEAAGIKNENPEDKTTPWYEIRRNNLYIDAYVLMEAIGDTYEKREALKKHGFTFNTGKKNAWTCKVKASMLEKKKTEIKEDKELEGIEIEMISRKTKKTKPPAKPKQRS